MRTIRRCFIPLLLLALPAMVQAQFNYTVSGGNVTITQYTGPGGAVVIPDFIAGMKVIAVATGAFNGNNTVTSVTFGTNVTTIATYAILQCYNLTAVSIPASVTNISTGPFADCVHLVTISVNASNSYYTNISQVLFNKTQTSLLQFPGGVTGSYTIPGTVTNVGQAFLGNSLSSLTVYPTNQYYTNANGALLNKSQTTVFSYPGALAGPFIVPSTVTTIASTALEYSFGVTSITIGPNVNSIGDFAFFDIPTLTAITLDPANLFYSSTNGVLYNKAKTQLIQYPLAVGGSYTIPATVLDIAVGAFAHAQALTSVVIPNSVTNIDAQAFYDCENLAGLTLGNHVTSIGSLAFYYCLQLPSVVFPASVNNFGSYAFGACQSLTNACFEGSPPVNGGAVFYFDNALATILYVSSASGWGSFYDGFPTTPCPTCGGTPPPQPRLNIAGSGTNVIVRWPTNFTGYTLQATTNLTPPTVWITNTPAPVVAGTNNVVTNVVSGTRKLYRLIH